MDVESFPVPGHLVSVLGGEVALIGAENAAMDGNEDGIVPQDIGMPTRLECGCIVAESGVFRGELLLLLSHTVLKAVF